MKITEVDFNHLWGTGCEVCNDLRIQEKDDRFLAIDTRKPIKIDKKAKWAFWFENYSEVILARHFLESKDFICQIALDEHNEAYMAVIFTNYEYKE